MVLPTSHLSALLLLILSFVCLGSWVNTFKLAGARWRFELFSLDFAIGALLVAVAAAYTLGTMGADLAFSDRMLVSGRAAQAYVVMGGFLFNLGNMLLLAAVALLGMATAFPLSVGVALIIDSFFNFRAGNLIFLLAGIVLTIPALLTDAAAARSRKLPTPTPASVSKGVKTAGAKTAHRTAAAAKTKMRKTTKGLIVGIVSGVLWGLFYPLVAKGTTGEFGLGAYAGTLLFSVGVLISTVVFSFYFMNIAIEGEALSPNAYFQGKASQHFLGFAGGALWVLGILAAALATSSPAQTGLSGAPGFIVPIASVLLVMFWGVVKWKEFAAASRSAKVSLGFTAILFLCALICFGLGA